MIYMFMASNLDFTVYAIKLQPSGQTGFFEACREAKVIGTGWDPRTSCDSPDDIEAAHKRIGRTNKRGDLRHELRYIVKEMNDCSGDSQPDYVWVNEGSEFAICKVTSECTTSHDISESLRQKLTNQKGTQIHNIRDVEWTDVPIEFVPGYVKRKFTGRFGTLNQMDKGVDDDAKKVIKKLHAVDDFDNERTLEIEELESNLGSIEIDKLFSTLDSDDTEELVLDYLQSQGWRITKYSTGDSQAKYECELRRVKDGGREAGFVQVKSGNASLDPNDFQELGEQGQVFLFSTSTPKSQKQVTNDSINMVEPEEVADYLRKNIRWLPTPTLLRLSFSV